MQYINTSRGGEGGGNNAELARDNTGVVRLKRRLARGDELRMPYKWTAQAWAEIESGIVGLCAYECHEPGGDMGEAGGHYLTELLSAYEGLGVSAHMLRIARSHGPAGGVVELQAHEENQGASLYYGRLGFRRVRWWEPSPGGGRQLAPPGGRSLAEPQSFQAMWRAEGGVLDQELRGRADRRGEPTGVRYVGVGLSY